MPKPNHITPENPLGLVAGAYQLDRSTLDKVAEIENLSEKEIAHYRWRLDWLEKNLPNYTGFIPTRASQEQSRIFTEELLKFKAAHPDRRDLWGHAISLKKLQQYNREGVPDA
jgi:hypothetical protein